MYGYLIQQLCKIYSKMVNGKDTMRLEYKTLFLLLRNDCVMNIAKKTLSTIFLPGKCALLLPQTNGGQIKPGDWLRRRFS